MNYVLGVDVLCVEENKLAVSAAALLAVSQHGVIGAFNAAGYELFGIGLQLICIQDAPAQDAADENCILPGSIGLGVLICLRDGLCTIQAPPIQRARVLASQTQLDVRATDLLRCIGGRSVKEVPLVAVARQAVVECQAPCQGIESHSRLHVADEMYVRRVWSAAASEVLQQLSSSHMITLPVPGVLAAKGPRHAVRSGHGVRPWLVLFPVASPDCAVSPVQQLLYKAQHIRPQRHKVHALRAATAGPPIGGTWDLPTKKATALLLMGALLVAALASRHLLYHGPPAGFHEEPEPQIPLRDILQGTPEALSLAGVARAKAGARAAEDSANRRLAEAAALAAGCKEVMHPERQPQAWPTPACKFVEVHRTVPVVVQSLPSALAQAHGLPPELGKQRHGLLQLLPRDLARSICVHPLEEAMQAGRHRLVPVSLAGIKVVCVEGVRLLREVHLVLAPRAARALGADGPEEEAQVLVPRRQLLGRRAAVREGQEHRHESLGAVHLPG
mmetsp:Transcript_56225/g.164289  ORF Transcript_56225/g.164289 Transcript_56225/m.164289 type:complete len:503 (-) Transcript_56225:372-1880(-)